MTIESRYRLRLYLVKFFMAYCFSFSYINANKVGTNLKSPDLVFIVYIGLSVFIATKFLGFFVFSIFLILTIGLNLNEIF